MKKFVWMALLLTVLMVVFAACDDAPPVVTESPSTNPPETTEIETDSETETETETEPPHTHAWSDWATVREASCTGKGQSERTCACGEKETQDVDAWGHTEVIDAAVAPTCTETGLTEGKHCSVCDTVLLAQETVAALGHTPGAVATCTTNQICTVCEAELVAALGHTEVIDAAVAPTCTETGLTEGKHCSTCSFVIIVQTNIPKTSHEESQWIVDVEATKETDGVQHIECIGCGVLIRTEILPATGSIGLEYCYVLGKRYVIGVGTCTDSKIVIPEVYNGQPVVGIYDWAFKNCDFLEEIVLPESVTEIHGKAFEGAKNLHTVYYNGSTYTSLFNSGNCFAQIKDVKVVFGGTKIPSNILLNCKTVKTVEIRGSVREIGDSAFSGCTNLTSVTISDGVTSIGKQAFYKCSSLVSITLPASITSIGEEAFYECSSLVSVTLSAGLTSINTRAFCFCRALKTITFRGTAEQWISVSKGTGWNSFVPATLVRCSDGSITIR